MKAILKFHQACTRYDDCIHAWGGAVLGLGLRLFVAWQFLKAGLTKVADWSATLALFRDEYHVPVLPPELAAVMGAMGELIFPVLLILGLFSRSAALGLFLVNVMAVISYPQLFQLECPAAINDHFYWGMLLLTLFAFGPGKFSLDAWFKSERFNTPCN